MARAIGMVECTTVSTGFKAADEMAKAADVEILQAEVCLLYTSPSPRD